MKALLKEMMYLFYKAIEMLSFDSISIKCAFNG